MRKFKDLGIKTTIDSFLGDKIKLSKLINKEISVHKFKIVESKHNNGKCLYMQIQVGESKHVVFTGATILIDTIQKIPESAFPFSTVIVNDNDRYEFS